MTSIRETIYQLKEPALPYLGTETHLLQSIKSKIITNTRGAALIVSLGPCKSRLKVRGHRRYGIGSVRQP